MSDLIVIVLTQIATAFLWYPVAYRLTERTGLVPTNDRMFEYHRPYAYLLGVAFAYLTPTSASPAYWVMLLVIIPLGSSMLAALLARVRREEVSPIPFELKHRSSGASTSPGKGLHAGRITSVSRNARRERTIKSKTPL